MADQISALASASETISGIDGIYMAIFIGIPPVQLAVRKVGAGPWPQKQQERKQNQRIISGGTNQYEIH